MALKEIRLYGKLGSKFGRSFKLDVETPAEAINALCCIIPGFELYLRHAKRSGVVFSCFKGKENIGVDDLKNGIGDRVFKIAPVIQGSKKAGLFQTILGAVLVVVGVVVGVTTGWTGVGGAVGISLAMTGAGMMMGGVIQMLSGQKTGLSTSTSNQPNYAFGGAVNTTAQGYPIPVLWGEREVGGAIISAGVAVNER